jgi:hypothetical protein
MNYLEELSQNRCLFAIASSIFHASLSILNPHLQMSSSFGPFDTWEGWTPDNGTVTVIDGHGRVEESHEAHLDPKDGLVHLTATFRVLDTGEEFPGPSLLRFISRDHPAGLLEGAGLAAEAWVGDWDGSPCTDTSREIIAVTRLAPTTSR